MSVGLLQNFPEETRSEEIVSNLLYAPCLQTLCSKHSSWQLIKGSCHAALCLCTGSLPDSSKLGQYSRSILLPRLHRPHKILLFHVYSSSYSHILPKPLWKLHSKNSHVRRLESDISFPGSTGSFGRDFQPLACCLFTVLESITWSTCLWGRRLTLLKGSCCWIVQPSDGGWCHHRAAWNSCLTNTIKYMTYCHQLLLLKRCSPFFLLISKHLFKKAPLEFHQKWLGYSAVKRMTFILIQIHIVLA